jgi:predicted RNA-binding Zn-ribbon protein involved in translation (DUF1610 family)
MLRSVADATCASCGKGLASNDVLYTGEAKIVCAECAGKAEISRDEARSARNIKRAALTCLVAALLGLAALMTMFALGFWACAVISVSAGLFAGNSMISNGERFLRYLSPVDKTVIWVCTLGGLGIAMFETLSMFGIIPLLFRFR